MSRIRTHLVESADISTPIFPTSSSKSTVRRSVSLINADRFFDEISSTMMLAKVEKRFGFAEQIENAIDSLDSVLAGFCGEIHTDENQLAKIVEQIERVKKRLSSVLDSDSPDLSTIFASCSTMLDDSIRLAKQASVVSLRQTQLIQSLSHIQSLLCPLMATDRRSNSKVPPTSPSSSDEEPTTRFQRMPTGKPPSGQESRQHKRVPLETDVDFVGDTNFYTGFVEDISNGGLYVSTFNLQPIGTCIELRFTLPSGHYIKVPGRVRWVRDLIDPDDNSSPGMGVSFEDLNIEDKKRIDDFIKRRAPLFYDEDI